MKRIQLLILTTAGLNFAMLHGAAQIVVDVGDHGLAPNTPNQTINLFVSGGTPISALNFNVQIADGFPDVPGSTLPGPKLTGVDILGTAANPTIFFANNQGQVNPNALVGDFDQIRFRTTITQSGTVAANGLLAILTVDTSGIDLGVFDLRLNNVFGGATTFVNSQGVELSSSLVTITDGTITVSSAVPEPMSSALVAVSLLGGALWMRRNRKA